MNWEDIRPLIRAGVEGLYDRDAEELDDWTYLRDISGRLREHLERQLACHDLDAREGLEVRAEHHRDSRNETKVVRNGGSRGSGARRRPSVTIHKRGTEQFNTVALEVKYRFRSAFKEITDDYWAACGFVLDERLHYPFAICLQLTPTGADARAYLAERRLLLMDDRLPLARKHLDRLYEIATSSIPRNLAAKERLEREVAQIRNFLFRDVSSDLFGKSSISGQKLLT